MVGLHRQGQADHHEEQHRAEGLGEDVDVHRAHLDVGDTVRGCLDALVVHAKTPGPVHAQFLGAAGDGVVVTLQLILMVARQVEALDAFAAGDELHGTADHDGDHHHQEHRHRQIGQVAQAAQGDRGRDGQWREREGEIADGVDVMGQHRDQPVGAIALDLSDGRRQHLLTEVFAQGGNDPLADVIGTDIGNDRTDQRQHTQRRKRQNHPLGHPGGGVQRIIDGRQQQRDGQAAGHAQGDGHGHDGAKGPEQCEQTVEGAALGVGHRYFPESEWRGLGTQTLTHDKRSVGASI